MARLDGVKPGVLLVANWKSDVGFAWWLMESYWAAIARHVAKNAQAHLTFPELNALPDAVAQAPIQTHELDFGRQSLSADLGFIRQHNIRMIYLSDRKQLSSRYLAYRLAGVRIIISHDHTPGLRPPATGIKRLVKSLLQRLPLVTVDTAIGATDFVRDRLIHTNCIPAHKCATVANGLPDADPVTAVSISERYAIPEDRLVMVMLARANPYKGIGFALECLAQFLQQSGNRALHFLFLGDGEYLPELEAQAERLGVASNVTFAGYVTDAGNILPACDFAIHPSHGEVGYCLAILEYMRAGLPLLVPDNPSVCGATIDGETGIVFREKNTASFVDALERITGDDALRAQMARSAEQHVERFSLSNAHASLITIVSTLIRERAALSD
ncbi:MAG: glycosyltransferase family 4 protein [Pseudomonadota bacterium]